MKVLTGAQLLRNDILIVKAGKKYEVAKVNWTKPYIRSYTIITKNEHKQKIKVKIPKSCVIKEIK
jgi:hypothetical protein